MLALYYGIVRKDVRILRNGIVCPHDIHVYIMCSLKYFLHKYIKICEEIDTMNAKVHL